MSTPHYILDTDIASYAIKGRTSTVDAMLTVVGITQVCISAVTRAELVYGIQVLPALHKIHRSTRRFLTEVTVIPWGADAADAYAEIRHRLKSSGRPIGDRDTMIAAHAISLGAVLVSNNMRHHARLSPPLDLENWAIAKA